MDIRRRDDLRVILEADKARPRGGLIAALPCSRARMRRNIRLVILTDSARFRVDDPDPLILASFACPYCLDTPGQALFNLEEPNGSAVLCTCRECRQSWVVAVNPGQAMRLAIAPPGELELEAA